MNHKARHSLSVIVQWLLEENWSQEQLDAFLRYLGAWQWSEETEKIVRAADGLLKEIHHRDLSKGGQEAKPWENLLGYIDAHRIMEVIRGGEEMPA